jgi:hypothetical protein
MKFIGLFLIITAGSAWAIGNEVNCDLQQAGLLPNSPEIREVRFQTLTDIFTINNAKTLIVNINGVDVTFVRTSIEVQSDHSKMSYIIRRGRQISREAHVMIDRTPGKVISDRQYHGNITILADESEPQDNRLTQNFHCRI